MNASNKILNAVFSLALVAGMAGLQKEAGAQDAELENAAKQTTEKTKEAAKAAGKKAKQAEKYVDDSAITAKIKANILADPKLKVLQIGVTTNQGVVKLEGEVDSQQSIDRSKAIARHVNGVKSVESELVIKKTNETSGLCCAIG